MWGPMGDCGRQITAFNICVRCRGSLNWCSGSLNFFYVVFWFASDFLFLHSFYVFLREYMIQWCLLFFLRYAWLFGYMWDKENKVWVGYLYSFYVSFLLVQLHSFVLQICILLVGGNWLVKTWSRFLFSWLYIIRVWVWNMNFLFIMDLGCYAWCGGEYFVGNM